MPAIVGWCPTPAEWVQLTQPTLVIEGDRSWPWIRELVAMVVDRLPNGELATLEGLDLSAPGSAPETVARTTVDYVDRVGAWDSVD